MNEYYLKYNMLIFYDLETTGLNPYHNRITEICCIKEVLLEFNNKTFTTLINPEQEIPEIVTKITGIDKSMVIDKPTFNQISDQLLCFLDSKETIYLVAHNNDGFDKLVLTSHFKRKGIDINKYDWVFLDTLLIAKKLYPNFKRYNLKFMCEKLDVPILNAHRAEDDTKMLKNLYYKMLINLKNKLNVEFDELIQNPALVYNFIY